MTPLPLSTEPVMAKKDAPVADRLVHQLAGVDQSLSRGFVPVSDPAFDALIAGLASSLREKWGSR